MFYKDKSFKKILDNILKRIDSTIDKRQGSIVYDMGAPVSAELAQVYLDLKEVADSIYPDNNFGEQLDLRVTSDTPLKRRLATPSFIKARFTNGEGKLMDIPEKSRFTSEGIYFIEDRKVGQGIYILKSETNGSRGNLNNGSLIPISSIAGLAKAEIIELYQEGYDEETDEDLLIRYYDYVRMPPTSGNKAHYRMWAKEVPGVGEAKVQAKWNGPGTVKVVIVDYDMGSVGEELIKKTYDYIETQRPVGPEITVVSATPKNINIQVKVKLSSGYELDYVMQEFKKALEEYRVQVSFREHYISIAKIGSLILSTEGVLDYENLTLNGEVANVELMADETPVFEVNMEV